MTSGTMPQTHRVCSLRDLPAKQPIQDVATRWFSSYGMVEWFREQQQAVQMYDVKHGAEASKNDAYKKNRLQNKDWAIIVELEQSVAGVERMFSKAGKCLWRRQAKPRG